MSPSFGTRYAFKGKQMPRHVAPVAGPWAFDGFSRLVALPLTIRHVARCDTSLALFYALTQGKASTRRSLLWNPCLERPCLERPHLRHFAGTSTQSTP